MENIVPSYVFIFLINLLQNHFCYAKEMKLSKKIVYISNKIIGKLKLSFSSFSQIHLNQIDFSSIRINYANLIFS